MKNPYLLALAAYVLFSITDAMVKTVGRQHMSVFEIVFFINLVAGLLLLNTRHPGERWRDFLRMEKSIWVHGRAVVGVLSSCFATYAFVTIPMAEVYSLIFLSPAFVTILSATVLRERVGIWRWSAVAVGFVGVLLVLRPGVMTPGSGHLAAATAGLSISIAIIIMRGPAKSAKRTSLLGVLFSYQVIVNGAAMLLVGFVVPTPREMAELTLAGAAFGFGQWAFLMAPRYGTANQIAPMHYVQLVCAIVFGLLFFNEVPDVQTILGVLVIAGAGLIIFAREQILNRQSAPPER